MTSLSHAEYRKRKEKAARRNVPAPVVSLLSASGTPHRLPPPLEQRMAARERKNAAAREYMRRRQERA